MLKRHKANICSPKRKKGQSTLEYIIIVTAVIAVILVFLGPGGVFRRAFNTTLAGGTNMMTNFSARLQQSYPNK